ncbi:MULTISPECIES: MFS transporter [Brevundimonas]|uniref:MFS transporter n=1 Tax=Brevundimonas TaxID=41275 RepID=UPI0005F80485|nr:MULTISPECIES: MFS transporter [Brevundimonas]KJV37804.1 hypothetical protein VH88_15175 [Brevundimonas sp. KM4]MBC1184005.1 MFS transporter [Brevundimonas huaxiensis]
MRNWLLVPTLGFGQMVAFASSYYLLGVLADPMADAAGGQPARLFAALSAAFLLSAVLTPFAGRAIEKRGGRTVQAFAHVAFAVALLVMCTARGPFGLWLGVTLLGVGMGSGLYGTAFAILVELRGTEARRGITAVSLIGALGGGLGWPISRALLEAGDWRLACGSWALAHLLLCLPLTLALVPRRLRGGDVSAETAKADCIVWDRKMLQLAGLFSGAWVVSTAMGAHLPRILAGLGMTTTDAPWAAGLMAMSAIVARVFDLVVLHKSHPLTTVRLACLFHPVGALTALATAGKAVVLLPIGQGLGNGLLSVASGVLPLQIYGPDRYAVRQAMVLTPARYLQAGAPVVFALALDVSVTLALVLSSAVCLAMLSLTLGLASKR